MSSPDLLPPTGALVPDVHKIAVLRANAIGDLVVAVPALEALRAAYPAAEITVLGTTWHPQLLETRPGPWDRVVVVPPYPGIRDEPGASSDSAEVSEFLAQQRLEGYDLALQLHGGGGNSNPFVTALGARLTAGARDVGAPPLNRTTPYVYYQHEVLRFLEVVGLVGAVPVRLEPHIAVTSADRAAAAADVLPAGLGSFVAIHPGATDPRRRWPPDSFARVGEALVEAGAELVLVGAGDDDAAAAAEIVGRLRVPANNLVNRLSISALVGVLERATVVVADDSGPRHLAAAVGTATVGIYWCGNLINAGPLTRARHRVGVSFRTICPECGADQSRGRCPHNPSFVADVPVDEVARAASELFHAESGEKALRNARAPRAGDENRTRTVSLGS